jgi:hypothetical protein
VYDDAVDVRPLLNEAQDLFGMFFEENVLGSRICCDIVETESQHSDKRV